MRKHTWKKLLIMLALVLAIVWTKETAHAAEKVVQGNITYQVSENDGYLYKRIGNKPGYRVAYLGKEVQLLSAYGDKVYYSVEDYDNYRSYIRCLNVKTLKNQYIRTDSGCISTNSDSYNGRYFLYICHGGDGTGAVFKLNKFDCRTNKKTVIGKNVFSNTFFISKKYIYYASGYSERKVKIYRRTLTGKKAKLLKTVKYKNSDYLMFGSKGKGKSFIISYDTRSGKLVDKRIKFK